MTAFEKVKGERPSPDHVWCDECFRWEWEDGNNVRGRQRIKPRGFAVFLYSLSSFVGRIANIISRRADLAFIRDNRRRGLIVEPKRSRL